MQHCPQNIWTKMSSTFRFPGQRPLFARHSSVMGEVPRQSNLLTSLPDAHRIPLHSEYPRLGVHHALWAFQFDVQQPMRCQLSPATKCHQSKFPADSGELICYTMIVWIWNQLNSRLHRMMWNPPADPDEIGMFCSAAGQYYQQIGHDVRFTLLHQDLSCSKSSDQCMTAVQSLTQNDSIVICWCESALTLYSLSVQSTDNVLVICTGHLLYPWSTCGQQFYCCTAKGPNVSLGITEQARRWRGWMRDDVRWIGGVYSL